MKYADGGSHVVILKVFLTLDTLCVVSDLQKEFQDLAIDGADAPNF